MEPTLFNLLGSIYSKLYDYSKAVQCYKKAISLNPSWFEPYYNLGTLYMNLGELLEAEAYLRMAYGLNDHQIEVLVNLGVLLMKLDRSSEAEGLLTRAVELRPSDPDAHLNLGICLRNQQRHLEALEQFNKTEELDHTDPDLFINRGVVLRELLRVDEAIEQYRKALEIDPNHAEAHYNLALALMLKGNLKDGWAEYQWRWQTEDFRGLHIFNDRLWDGRLGNYRLLLKAEQGFGDTIQFFRFVPLLTDMGMRVTLQCQKQLTKLLQSQCGVNRVVSYDDAVDDYDFQRPLMDVPYLLGTDLSSIPSAIPYIRASLRDIDRWSFIKQEGKGRLAIGLVWTGSRTNKRALYRSCPFDAIRPLFETEGCVFFHLSKEDVSPDINKLPSGRLIDLSGEIEDFSDTSAIIHHLDLVISIDTAVAHLAGAMGKPVWLILHYSSDWRWMLDTSSSPWYPTMRIFRQKRPGGWDELINQLQNRLRGEFSL